MRNCVLLPALLALVAGCHKDTLERNEWRRTIEPRLSVNTRWQPCRRAILRPGQVVADARCAEITPASCDERILTAEAARHAVASRTACIDDAITVLQKASRRDSGAMSDLAAAFYVRAQRDDRASDLLRSLDAAEQAVAARPVPAGARFNRALALEAVGLTDNAVADWDEVARTDQAQWAAEARLRRDTLIKGRGMDGERQWAEKTTRIGGMLQANDEKGLAALLAPFPYTAERYFEDRILNDWAENPSERRLHDARLFANALPKAFGDHYATDVVGAIERAASSPQKLAALEAGHKVLATGHQKQDSLKPNAIVKNCRYAARLLKRGGSPLSLSAQLALIGALTNQSPQPVKEIFALIDAVEKEARKRGYTRVAIRARLNGGNALFRVNRYVDSLASYGGALADYESLRDREGIASSQAGRIGILDVLGQYEQASSVAVTSVRDASRIVEARTHHLLIGETAVLATKLDCPHTALAYMNAELRHFQSELANTSPEDLPRVALAKAHVAIARRHRAEVELTLEQYGEAQKDLDEAIRLASKEDDVSARQALEARLEEVNGQGLLHVDPANAGAAFARASNLSGDEYESFRISLLIEHADAMRRIGRNENAEGDLREAIGRLRKEESKNLEHRASGPDSIWKSYFERFQKAYDQLIRQLVTEGYTAEAFGYAELARAYEPLNLILRHLDAPAELRDLAKTTGKALVPKIQALLPRGTFLVEYRVLDDETFAWIVSHDDIRFRRLLATRADTERWTKTLQQAAENANRGAFADGLYAPYDKLVRPPLTEVDAMGGKGEVRLVFLPDGAMHGLPFAALRDPLTQRYLIERAPVSVSGSAILYVASLLRDGTLARTNLTALLVGNPAFDTNLAKLPHLPAAGDEAKDIAAIYPPPVRELLGRDATTPRFLKLAQDSAIIDIAAHAITSEEPTQSFFLFAPSAGDSGALNAQTLLERLRLDNTRLVVLGACRSGGGIAVGPQGVAPLVRPFVAAQVPGIIGTLWDIGDATAKVVLVSFHRHYQQGSDAAVALRTTQMEMLKSEKPGLRSELAWAPYEVIGFASSPYAAARDVKKEKPP